MGFWLNQALGLLGSLIVFASVQFNNRRVILAAQAAVHGDIPAALLVPHRAALAARLQGIIVAEHGCAVVFVGEIHAPGDKLRAPFAVGAAAPLAVFAVAALCRGIAQLVDSRRDEHIRAVVRQRAGAQQQRQGQQQGDDVLHVKASEKNLIPIY